MEIKDVTKLKGCVIKCCLKDNCNVAFMNIDICYHITCNSNEVCVPTLSLNPEVASGVSMVLVKPADEDDTWEDILEQQGEKT